MRTRPTQYFVLMLCVMGAAQSAMAQLTKPRLQAVEQMVDDVSPLAVSLRSFQTGLGVPSGFESVYRMPSDGTKRGRLMRIDGALAATFPESVYADLIYRDRKIGVMPIVPAGTVFKIGLDGLLPPPKELPVQTSLTIIPESPVRRIASDQAFFTSPRAGQFRSRTASSASDAAIREAVQVLGEAEEREARMRSLLRRAAQAEAESKRPHRSPSEDAQAARGRSGSSSK